MGVQLINAKIIRVITKSTDRFDLLITSVILALIAQFNLFYYLLIIYHSVYNQTVLRENVYCNLEGQILQSNSLQQKTKMHILFPEWRIASCKY